MFRAGILGAVGALALTVSANAADIYRAPAGGGLKDGPYVPVAAWTGFYAGVNGGYASGAYDDQLSDSLVPFGGLKPEGGFGGGQIGYNWQGFSHPNLVFGIEADIQAADISDSATDIFGGKYESKVDWLGTVRGRLGYALDRTLVYATGGLAYGGVSNRNWGYSGELPYDFHKETTATGYVVGGGLEYKITPAWSFKGEYQYINLGKNDPVDALYGAFSSSSTTKLSDDAFHTVRVGLNYHFGQGYEPLK
jgi:outer membrane immunogenic protein